jgi:hypothetical protein
MTMCKLHLRPGILATLACALALAGATSARAANLNQQHATLQFEGTMLTHWTLPPQDGGSDECFDATEHGSGRQTIHFKSNHVNVTIVDSGPSIAFQIERGERARPRHLALGFRGADAERVGFIETEYEYAPNHSLTCGPVPKPHKRGEQEAPDSHLVDASGCGGDKVPWDAQPIVVGSKLMPEVATFLPTDLRVQCPFFGAISGDEQGEMPNVTATHVSVSEVRRVLSHKHGKLIIRGSHDWRHTSEVSPQFSSTTTVNWKAILIRAHP